MPFAVLLPVKPPSRGKSRLVGLPDEGRIALASAFALDTAAACLAATQVEAVLAVTDDALFAGALVELGCAAIPDGVTEDLNGSLRLAAQEAVRRWPGLRPVALCGDLPALRPAELDRALDLAADAIAAGDEHACFVADAAGSGTTLYTASAGSFSPAYGIDSARLHADSGALPLPGELVSLRHDVDTLEDLRDAASIGLGPRTTLAAGRFGLLV